jgi:twitching motility protein PilT
MELLEIFDTAADQKASDIHLAIGETPRIRVGGQLKPLDIPPLDKESFDRLLGDALPADYTFRLEAGLPVERTFIHRDLAFAGVVFGFGVDGIGATFRIQSGQLPDFKVVSDGAEPLFEALLKLRHGLVIISGPTGSGKTTVAWVLAQEINRTRADRIFIIERQPYYRFKSELGLITAIQVGVDPEGYSRALNIVFQADPDVIAVDDIPTLEAFKQMLVLAETGHLVIATLHAENPADAIGKLIETSSEESAFIRRSLSQNLAGVTCQKLLFRSTRPGRVPAYEWLLSTPKVREAIASGELDKLKEIQSSESDHRTFSAGLDKLIEAGEISVESANAHRPR